MQRVRRARLPAESALHTLCAPGDFLDCYAAPGRGPLRDMADRMMVFPVWAGWLLKLRNILVRPFGLQGASKIEAAQAEDHAGIFPVVSETPDELILGFDDSHLDFRISIFLRDGTAYCATWVRTKNRFGWFYLRAIMPFHILIVRSAAGRAA